jgi:hypothetical protein
MKLAKCGEMAQKGGHLSLASVYHCFVSHFCKEKTIVKKGSGNGKEWGSREFLLLFSVWLFGVFG